MTVPGLGGKPLAFKSVEELQAKIDAYFDMCDSKIRTVVTDRGGIKEIRKPYTMSGLALYLGCDRRTLVDYAHRDEYLPAIKSARQRVEGYIEEGMMTGEIPPIPSIFNLKNNFGWADKQEIAITGTDIKVVLPGSESDDNPAESE